MAGYTACRPVEVASQIAKFACHVSYDDNGNKRCHDCYHSLHVAEPAQDVVQICYYHE